MPSSIAAHAPPDKLHTHAITTALADGENYAHQIRPCPAQWQGTDLWQPETAALCGRI